MIAQASGVLVAEGKIFMIIIRLHDTRICGEFSVTWGSRLQDQGVVIEIDGSEDTIFLDVFLEGFLNAVQP